MGMSLKGWARILALTALISGSTSVVVAEEVDEIGRLEENDIPELMDRNANLDTFWEYATTLGDTKFFFNIDRQEQGITNSAFRTEALYKDLLRQQDENNPIIRTQDLPNPYSTSLFQLRNSSGANGLGTQVP